MTVTMLVPTIATYDTKSFLLAYLVIYLMLNVVTIYKDHVKATVMPPT